MILHLPHSQTTMPVAYPDLPQAHLNRHTDWFTDSLFEHPGAERFVFGYSRFYADMERLADDPLEEQGMGIFYTQTPWGVTYRQAIPDEVAKVRAIYNDWHTKLKKACLAQLAQQGRCVLVDGHSFSHHQVTDPEGRLPDINIGTNAKTTSKGLEDRVVEAFKEAGYQVAVNYPYAYSMEPTQEKGFETIMIEINKRCYLTEDFQPSAGYSKLKSTIDEVLEQIAAYELESK